MRARGWEWVNGSTGTPMRNHLRPADAPSSRAVIYLRQSTYKEESISLEMQELACRDYCARNGYVVVAVKEDPGISGRTWKRRGVQETMELIEQSTADVIVLWKWSRLSRNRKDWALAIDMTDLAGGRIESATEPIDTATASGRFARGVMTEFSAYQSELIGEVWAEVRQRRLNLGLPTTGRLPFGWRWVKGVGIEQDPEQAPVVREMYRRYIAGDGSATIAKWLNEQGIRTQRGNEWTRVRPLTVLDSPIHVGLVPYRGKTYPGAHEPIITEATWQAYQDERAARRNGDVKPRRSDYVLSLLVRCTCGAKMYGKGAVTAGKWYGGYICSNTLMGHEGRAYVSALSLEPPVIDWLMTFDPDVMTARDETLAQARSERLLREMNALERELAELTRQLAQGVVPQAAYLLARAQIEADLVVKGDEARKYRREARPPTPEEIAKLRAAWPLMTIGAKNLAMRQVVARIDLLSTQEARIATVWGDSSVVTL